MAKWTQKYGFKIAASIFSGFLVFGGMIGCSQTPKIYTMAPENLEEIRSGFGRVGVTISSYRLKTKIVRPAKGVTGGMTRGIVMGAATPVAIGFVSPVPGGTFVGLLVAPFTAVAGAVYGSTKGVPAEEIEQAEEAGNAAIAHLRNMNLRQKFVQELVNLGNKRTHYEFIDLSGMGPSEPKENVRYDLQQLNEIDTILELRVDRSGLWGLYTIDPPSTVFIEINARLVRTQDNEIVINERFFCGSEEERKYVEWSANDGQLFIDEYVICFYEIVDKIIDDLFLVYPLSSR